MNEIEKNYNIIRCTIEFQRNLNSVTTSQSGRTWNRRKWTTTKVQWTESLVLNSYISLSRVGEKRMMMMRDFCRRYGNWTSVQRNRQTVSFFFNETTLNNFKDVSVKMLAVVYNGHSSRKCFENWPIDGARVAPAPLPPPGKHKKEIWAEKGGSPGQPTIIQREKETMAMFPLSISLHS